MPHIFTWLNLIEMGFVHRLCLGRHYDANKCKKFCQLQSSSKSKRQKGHIASDTEVLVSSPCTLPPVIYDDNEGK